MKRRVLHIIPFLWSGAGNVVSRLCLSQRRQWDVAIVTSNTSRGQRDWPAYRALLVAGGVRHHAIDFFDRDAGTFWHGVAALEDLVSRWRPDVVHAHAGVPACAAAAVRDGSRHPFRLVNHVYSWGVGRPEWMNAMDLSGMRRADRVICSAYAYRDLLRRHGIPGRRIAYVPWGLDLAAITPRTSPYASACASAPRLGFIGRIEPRKGQLELVRGFARYLRHAPSARLELVGPIADDDYAARIGQTIRRLGLERQVSMTGHIRHPHRRLVRWDLFVSLSSDEGQGMAVLEAMAAGVPVLSLVSAGVEDYLEAGVNGWVCPDVSPAAVARAIRRAVADPRRSRIVGRARRMIDRRYTWSRTVSAIDRLYRS